jgi:hypothetical protein
LPSGDGQLLLGVAESLMHYRYVIENDMVSQIAQVSLIFSK